MTRKQNDPQSKKQGNKKQTGKERNDNAGEAGGTLKNNL